MPVADVPVYHGKFGEREATRLLWRAGFGPRPGEARKLARRFNLRGAVRSLTRPRGRERLSGPPPVDGDGLPLAPYDAYGHDVLWWLDRMVRTNHPTVERMALIWHDWFATADVDSQRLSIDQAQLFERRGPRLVPRPAAGGHHRPGDADLALRRRQRGRGAERELRAAR